MLLKFHSCLQTNYTFCGSINYIFSCLHFYSEKTCFSRSLQEQACQPLRYLRNSLMASFRFLVQTIFWALLRVKTSIWQERPSGYLTSFWGSASLLSPSSFDKCILRVQDHSLKAKAKRASILSARF